MMGLGKDPRISIYKQSDQCTVWLVDGYYIRNHIDINFEHGGHHLVYWWIPPCEVWIEKEQPFADYPFVALHELDEHLKMRQGLNYDQAHEKALELEKLYRKAYSDDPHNTSFFFAVDDYMKVFRSQKNPKTCCAPKGFTGGDW